MELTSQQQAVFEEIMKFMNSDASVFILQGYAGTGKTTMVKHIADYISSSHNLALMAPTGRAARVLQDKTGHIASTIHKAIYGSAALLVKKTDDLAKSEFKLCFPIAIPEGKVVAIVDEASMLCSCKIEHEIFEFGTDCLMDDLLTYIRPNFGGKVIFVGDPAQLPPVGESTSFALKAEYFEDKGLKVMQAHLTEVLRQTGDSVILKNAMQIRNLLDSKSRNRLTFEEKKDDVESVPSGEFLNTYFKLRESGCIDSVIICYTNAAASRYNKDIRSRIYGCDSPNLRVGDTLMVVQNNYVLERMNGEFVKVLSIGGTVTQSAPVYVQEGGQRVQKTITLTFVSIEIPSPDGVPMPCLLLLDLLNNENPTTTIDEQRALYINFCMRNPHLRQGSEEFANALKLDPYNNCLKAKYGYAVTGHKCQGGEWDYVLVDYTGRTGLCDDSLRWAYTATTRAQKTLYFTNLPHITPFSKFRIEPLQSCSKMNEECRILGKVGQSPFHSPLAADYLHAKCFCIMSNMEWSQYKVTNVVSSSYLEVYTIQTPDGFETFDIRYKKGGVFLKAVPHSTTQHTVLITYMLNNELAMPYIFDFKPSDEVHAQLYYTIRSACDNLGVHLTNVVEHLENYTMCFYFRTTGSPSCLTVYIDKKGFVTYAKPMSLIGTDDTEFQHLIEEITNNFI